MTPPRQTPVTTCKTNAQTLINSNRLLCRPGARFTKYLMIMPKLRSTYNGRLIYQTSYEECTAFLGQDFLGKLVYDIPNRNFSTLYVTIVS